MFRINLFSPQWLDRWDEFVWSSNNGTIFHTRKFLSYHPTGRFKDHSLIFLKNDKIVAVLLATLDENESGSLLRSHPGSSFGGLVVPKSLTLKMAFQLVEAILNYAKSIGIQRIELTNPPIFYSERINHYIDFALTKNQFIYRKREVSSFITLDFETVDILSHFKSESRTAVRKAQKLGVVVKESNDLDSFYKILKKNLKLRHNVQPTHTLDELKLLTKLFPEKIKFYGAFLEKQLIAGVIMFHCNKLVTLAFYISHIEKYQEYRAVNLLFFEIYRLSIEQGFRYLDFGIFTVNMAPNWGLARFKENFGSMGIFRDTFVREF